MAFVAYTQIQLWSHSISSIDGVINCSKLFRSIEVSVKISIISMSSELKCRDKLVLRLKNLKFSLFSRKSNF